MIKELVSTIAEGVDGSSACKFALAVNQLDLLFSNSAFARSAAWISQQLAEAGMVEAEVVDLPADGRSRMQDWTMPLAWECDPRVDVLIRAREDAYGPSFKELRAFVRQAMERPCGA